MVELAQNLALVTQPHHQEAMTVDALFRVYLGHSAGLSRRSDVMRWGFNHAFDPVTFETGNKSVDDLLFTISSHPSLSVCHLAHTVPASAIRQAKENALEILERARKVRALDQTLPIAERLRRELRVSFAECPTALLDFLNIDAADFHVWLQSDDNRKRFWMPVPDVHILLTLIFEHDKDARNPTKLNDVNDLQLLRIALPTANIVLTDTPWCVITKRAKLDEQYNCVTLSKLGELPAALQTAGAL